MVFTSFTKPLLSSLAAAAFMGAVLMGGAGRWEWWNAWVLLVLLVIIGTLTGQLLAQNPSLAQERKTAASKAPPWDRRLVPIINGMMPLLLILSGLDARWGWSPPTPAWLSVMAVVVAVAGAWLTYRGMVANAFFSSHVRIQEDRQHTVVDQGPYAVLRHPGYAGAVLFNVSVPLLLGSWCGFSVGVVTGVLLVVRTRLEDRMLQAQLPGYAAYAQRVRFRLLPGIW